MAYARCFVYSHECMACMEGSRGAVCSVKVRRLSASRCLRWTRTESCRPLETSLKVSWNPSRFARCANRDILLSSKRRANTCSKMALVRGMCQSFVITNRFRACIGSMCTVRKKYACKVHKSSSGEAPTRYERNSDNVA